MNYFICIELFTKSYPNISSYKASINILTHEHTYFFNQLCENTIAHLDENAVINYVLLN